MPHERTLRQKLIEFGYTFEKRPPDKATAAAVAAERAEAVRFGEAIARIRAARESGSEPEPPASTLTLPEWEVLGRVRAGNPTWEGTPEGDVPAALNGIVHKLGMRDYAEFLAWLRAHDPAEDAAALLGVSAEQIRAYWATPWCDRPVYRCLRGHGRRR
jgi:hypothetical protein